jgi:peptidoglycan hydrolase-like protein with peptidoglycan-binding domain
MIDQLKPLIGKLTLFAKKRMGFQHPPRLFLRSDSENAQKMLGKTAHYDPQEKAVTLFTHNRHPKDILRSYAHELVHHTQNLRGDLSPEKCGEMGQGYAQANGHMREMEREAYEKGNMCFRDWEDTLNDKDTYIIIKIAESKNLKENKSMTTKITKEFLKETIRRVLLEKMTDEEFIEYGERNTNVVDTDAYRKAQARVAAKKKGADDEKRTAFYKQQADAAEIKKKALAKYQKFKDKGDAQKAARQLNKTKIAAQYKLDDETEKAIEAAEKSIAPPGIDYHKRNPSEPSKEIVKKYNEKVLAINADKKQKRVAIANSRDTQQVAAALSGKSSALNVNTATAAADPSYSAGGGPTADVGGYDLENMQDFSDLAAKPVASTGKSFEKEARQQARILKNRNFLPSIDSIAELQTRLADMGYMPKISKKGNSTADGDYGPMTNGAIKKLQNAAGITGRAADGVLGPGSLRAIRKNPELLDRLRGVGPDVDNTDLPGIQNTPSIGDVQQQLKVDDLADEEFDDDEDWQKRNRTNEAKIQTPEQEVSLYESRFSARNNRLFENLSKKWTK